MVDVGMLQSLSYVAAAIGVCVAAFYYVMMLRNMEKSRRRDMVFQKTNVNSYQLYDIMFDVARMTEWETLEEFERKYGYHANPEAWKKFIYLMNHYNCLGILLRDGIVDSNQIFQLYSAGFLIRISGTFKPWIDVQGINDDYFKGLKYLFSEAKRLYPNIGYQKLTRSLDERIAEVRKREEIVKASQK